MPTNNVAHCDFISHFLYCWEYDTSFNNYKDSYYCDLSQVGLVEIIDTEDCVIVIVIRYNISTCCIKKYLDNDLAGVKYEGITNVMAEVHGILGWHSSIKRVSKEFMEKQNNRFKQS